MAKVEIKTQRFPVVELVFPANPEPTDVQVFLDDLLPVFKRGKMAFVSDINLLKNAQVNAKMRQDLAEGIDRLVRAYPDHLLAEAVVASSPITRGIFTAYSWLKHNKAYPSRAFSTKQQAEIWAIEQLKKNGVKIE